MSKIAGYKVVGSSSKKPTRTKTDTAYKNAMKLRKDEMPTETNYTPCKLWKPKLEVILTGIVWSDNAVDSLKDTPPSRSHEQTYKEMQTCLPVDYPFIDP